MMKLSAPKVITWWIAVALWCAWAHRSLGHLAGLSVYRWSGWSSQSGPGYLALRHSLGNSSGSTAWALGLRIGPGHQGPRVLRAGVGARSHHHTI